MFQTLAEILKEIEPEPSFSQLVHNHLSQLSGEFELYFLTTKYLQTEREWIQDAIMNKPGESTLFMLEEDRLLEIAKVSLIKLQIISIHSGLKSNRNILRLPQ